MAQKIYPLKVFCQGQGRSLVLVHGFISTHRYWNQVVEHLGQHKFQVIAPDLLGFGDSPKPKDAMYNLEEQVSCLAEAIKATANPPYILVGHSMGAIAALKWAVNSPELFDQLIITGPPLLYPETIYQQLASLVHKGKMVSSKRLATLGVKSFAWLGIVPSKLLAQQKTWPKHIAADWNKHTRRSYQKTLSNAVYTAQILPLLEALKVPCVIIAAKEDATIGDAGLNSLKTLVKINPKLRLKLVNGGHNIPIQQAKVVADAILSV
jgi:pimeloyl-ACP methyl ester carboxylesterase